MAWSWFAQRFPRRLWVASDAGLAAMARLPSCLAPHPRELLTPDPFTPPGPPPMSVGERALLDAVLADPDSDEPRLRYADWCDRQGAERGHFIRLQLRRAAGGDAGSPAPEEDEVFARHALRWLAPFAPWSAQDVVFRRGFVEAMSLSGRAFISIGGGLFRTTPLRDVRLVAVQPFLDELARTASLAKLDRLDLSGNRVGPGGARALAASPHLSKLRHLVLRANDLDDTAAAEVARGAFPALRSLDVSDNPLTAAGERTLRETFGPIALLR